MHEASHPMHLWMADTKYKEVDPTPTLILCNTVSQKNLLEQAPKECIVRSVLGLIKSPGDSMDSHHGNIIKFQNE